MLKVTLKTGEDKRILRGHSWIYDNEIKSVEGPVTPGAIADVYSFKDNFIGRGYINPKSKIRVRILTTKQEQINREFFYQRIKTAWDYRQKVVDTSCCRVIFGEADFLPALIVDKFGDYLVVQTLALGIDQYKEMLVDILAEIIQPKGIYERNDVSIRELEGLEQRKGFLKGKFPTTVQVEENGIKLWVDLENGQKTGYFLDQKENRAAIRPIVKDCRVLDCFSHSGSFALHAVQYGAKEVTALDISEHAIDYVKKNVELNGFQDRVQYRVGNAFDVLREYQQEKEEFDVVILDPPAFAKSKSALRGAVRGYKDINLRGMKILKEGGFLVTCSCSHYMYTDLFLDTIKEAAFDARKTLRQVEFRTQSKDHPILLNSDESLYLKFGIFQVLSR